MFVLYSSLTEKYLDLTFFAFWRKNVPSTKLCLRFFNKFFVADEIALKHKQLIFRKTVDQILFPHKKFML